MNVLEKATQTGGSRFVLDSASLVSRGFKEGAIKAIPVLTRQGQVSPRDIACLLKPETVRNRKMLQEAVAWFTTILKHTDTIIVGKNKERSKKDPGQPLQTEQREQRALSQKEKRKTPGFFQGPPNEAALYGKESLLGTTLLSEEDVIVAYLREMAKYALLPHEEVVEIARRVREEGDLESRNKLVRHNLRMPVTVARKFLGRGLEFADLVQEGNLGLIRATEGFDETKGFKFSTYAWWWIRQAISRGVREMGSLVRRPNHFHEKRYHLLRAQREMERTLGCLPTALELAEVLGSPLDEVEAILALGDGRTTSLNDQVSESDERTQQEFYADTTSMDPHTLLEAKLEMQKSCFLLRRLMETLSLVEKVKPKMERNIQIFRMRYGLDGSFEAKSLEQIGIDVGLNRERVRQIINLVLEELGDQGLIVDPGWVIREIERVRELEVLVGQPAEL